MHILHVVGARPNFMKAAPVWVALQNCAGVRQRLVHTGQHYDEAMSDVFFRELDLPMPDENLAVGAGSHAQQTAEIMVRLEALLLQSRPDCLLVYGDVNSTVAAALVAAKLGVKLAHVEAGLRSFDRSMPEEINRLVTDQLSDLLFTPSSDGNDNLAREGIPPAKIHLVGNVMIDTLVRLLPKASAFLEKVPERFILVTLHRSANVDDPVFLAGVMQSLIRVCERLPVVFPIHPRTRKRMADAGLNTEAANLRLLPPLSYLEFLAWQKKATAVVTDSGGVQEETSFLGVPCYTLRDNTERPITLALGTNTLVGRDLVRLEAELDKLLDSGITRREAKPIPLWDGKASERIATILTR